MLGETTKDVVQAATGHRSKRETFTEEEKRIAGVSILVVIVKCLI